MTKAIGVGSAVLVTVPIKTTNPNNGAFGMSRNAAFARARRRKTERETARAFVLSVRPLPPMPVRVVVTRLAPSDGLDPHDGLGAALKGCIDGIADALGLSNDRDARVTWELNQRRAPKGVYAVEVRIEPRRDAA